LVLILSLLFFFLMITIALGIGLWLGSAFWGFLCVTVFLACLSGIMLRFKPTLFRIKSEKVEQMVEKTVTLAQHKLNPPK
jgi:hypothetical protein